MLNWDFEGMMLAEKGGSGSKDFPLGLLNMSTWGCVGVALCLGMKLNSLAMNQWRGSFLLPQACCHSWDQQDVVSVQIPSLEKSGAWQASPSQNLTFHLVQNSLDLVTCQVHWKRHLSEDILAESSFRNDERESKVPERLRLLEVTAFSAAGILLDGFKAVRTELRPRVLLSPTYTIFSQVPLKAELIES